MIVAAAGVDRNRAALRVREGSQRVVVAAVIEAEHDDGAGLGPQGLRVATPCRRVGEPAHVAMIAALDVFAQIGARFVGQMRRGEPDRVEAQRQCLARIASRISRRSSWVPIALQPRPR